MKVQIKRVVLTLLLFVSGFLAGKATERSGRKENSDTADRAMAAMRTATFNIVAPEEISQVERALDKISELVKPFTTNQCLSATQKQLADRFILSAASWSGNSKATLTGMRIYKNADPGKFYELAGDLRRTAKEARVDADDLIIEFAKATDAK